MDIGSQIISLRENSETQIRLLMSSATENEVLAFFDALKTNTSLKDLRIVSIGTSDSDFGIKCLYEALRTNATLESLDLSFTNITNAGSKLLANAISTNRSLKTLVLEETNISTTGVCSLASSLKENNSLTELNLSDNQLGDVAISGIAKALKVNQSITTLSLYQNVLNDSGARNLGDALRRNQYIAHLDLHVTRIGDNECGHIAEALTSNQSLETLNLYNNYISHVGAENIARALRINSHLVLLYLTKNKIGDEGAKHIADGLTENCCLRILRLGHAAITSKGAVNLADMLLNNKTLEELDLSYNNLGYQGAKRFAAALETNSTLASLNIKETGIGDLGCIKLAIALKVNETLLTINLGSNYVSDRAARFVADMLRVNKSLIEINLRRNPISKIGAEQIINALKVNQNLFSLELDRTGAKVYAKLDYNFSRKERAFFESLSGNQKQPWNHFRMMLVGQGQVGKTATVRSLLGKPFDPAWDSTIGASIHETETQKTNWKIIKKKSEHDPEYSSRFAYRLILDQAESYRSQIDNQSVSTYTSDDDKFFSPLLADSNDQKDDDDLYSVDVISSVNGAIDDGSIIGANDIIGEMVAMQDAATTSTNDNDDDDEFAYAGMRDCKSMEHYFDETMYMAARTKSDTLTLTIWDFGGQAVFYAMHHVFLTKTGIYIVVFDMTKMLNSQNQEENDSYLMFWLQSIKLHAPDAPIIIVGTNVMKIESEEEIWKMNDSIEGLVTNKYPQIVKNIVDKLSFFPIDNKTSDGIKLLRTVLVQVIRNDKNSMEPVSIKWMLLLDKITTKKGSENFLTLKAVEQMGADVGIHNKHELFSALSLLHERGMIIHLTSTSILKKIIVIEPQWLVNALSKLIRDGGIHTYDKEEFRKVGLEDDLETLFNHALASSDLLKFIWKDDQVDFFVDLMKRTMLLSEYNFSKSEEKYFLIPSLLKDKNTEKPVGLVGIFDFSDTFLPIGVFERLICLCVSHLYRRSNGSETQAQLEKPRLYQNAASIEFEPGFVVYLRAKTKLQQICMYLEDHSNAPHSLRIIHSMIRKLNYDVMGTGLGWKTKLQDPVSGELVDLDTARRRGLRPWFGTSNAELEPVPAENIDMDAFLQGL